MIRNSKQKNRHQSKERIAIIGGGPGGLLTAYFLEKRLPDRCDITVFEGTHRVGGKIITRRFEPEGTTYEAGAAELYDYSKVGADPLRELVRELGLATAPMGGRAVILNNRIINSFKDIRLELGKNTAAALWRFHRQARAAISPVEYHGADWAEQSEGPLRDKSFHALLSRIPDPQARHYIEVLIHSDMATESEHTNEMYGLQNYLMNYPDYMRLYTIVGGLEQLPKEIAKRLTARILLDQPVVRVEPKVQGGYHIFSRENGEVVSHDFEYAVVALPNHWIINVDWSATLTEPMRRHHAFYDHLAHYLRVTILFKRAFWRDRIKGSYFILDAFGGCCVYDESSRNAHCTHGVLSWLLAGEEALTMNNLTDDALIQRVLESAPACLGYYPDLFVEGRVDRYAGTVNALPGGYRPRDPEARHQPDAQNNPELFVVGDYLFDSTINGVLDSAAVVADWISEDIQQSRPLEVAPLPEVVGAAVKFGGDDFGSVNGLDTDLMQLKPVSRNGARAPGNQILLPQRPESTTSKPQSERLTKV